MCILLLFLLWRLVRNCQLSLVLEIVAIALPVSFDCLISVWQRIVRLHLESEQIPRNNSMGVRLHLNIHNADFRVLQLRDAAYQFATFRESGLNANHSEIEASMTNLLAIRRLSICNVRKWKCVMNASEWMTRPISPKDDEIRFRLRAGHSTKYFAFLWMIVRRWSHPMLAIPLRRLICHRRMHFSADMPISMFDSLHLSSFRTWNIKFSSTN